MNAPVRSTRADGAVNPSRLFIERPVATTLLMFAILMLGVVAYKFLPLSALPEVDYPTIQVQTFYPGASPEVMTSSVTAPLERQFGQMPSLSQMMSQSSAGSSVITLRFGLDIGIDIAEQEVQAAINAAGNLLPSDLPAPPIYAKVNPADAPILTLGVTSKTLKLTDVEDVVEGRLVPKLSQLAGVGLVSISGGQRPAVRIHANPLALAAYAVNLDDLQNDDRQSQRQYAQGQFRRAGAVLRRQRQRPDPRSQRLSQFHRRLSQRRAGEAERRRHGRDRGRRTAQLSAWMNTTPALIVNIQRQPGANVIQVVDSIKKLLPQLTASLPHGDRDHAAHRPHHDDPRLGRGRRIRALARGRARRAGDLPVPAQYPGDDHPEPFGAAVARRRAGDHVRVQFQPRQSLADGADDRDRASSSTTRSW